MPDSGIPFTERHEQVQNSPSHTFLAWKASTDPTEEALWLRMEQEGLSPYTWGNAPNDRYPAHVHAYRKVIYVITGSITFFLPETGEELLLEAGDRLELPAGVQHAALVGVEGVACLEAKLGPRSEL